MGRVRVTLYGGLNEIGGNKFLVHDGDDAVLLDFGTPIGTRNLFYEEYLKPRAGAYLRDLFRLHLLPDIDGLYRHDLLDLARSATDKDLPESARSHVLRSGRAAVHGILLTHAHVDHFQDLAFVDPQVPVYSTATTRAMLEAIEDVGRGGIEAEIVSASERSEGMSSAKATIPNERVIDSTPVQRDIRTCPEQQMFRVGPFEVVAVPVDHSVPGGVAFSIRTPSGKRIFYTGDLRFHGSLAQRTSVLRETTKALAPDLLLTEGTRIALEEPSDNEASVERDVERLVRGAAGLAIAEFGW
ncbi:MAG: MBL fold metallo-hydrolase, partial [Myxococcota bacterium]